MTIADQLRSLAKHNEANIVLANDLDRLANELDAKAAFISELADDMYKPQAEADCAAEHLRQIGYSLGAKAEA